MVRIVHIDIKNFKNITHGKVDFRNKASVNSRAELSERDINGIYGQNGSGKTALIEAIDAISYLMRGESIPYNIYGGLIEKRKKAKIELTFFIKEKSSVYRAVYKAVLKNDHASSKIIPIDEELSFQLSGYEWKKEKAIAYSVPNHFTETNDYINDVALSHFKPSNRSAFNDMFERLGLYASGQNSSVFFCEFTTSTFKKEYKKQTGDMKELMNVVISLNRFACVNLHIIKVSQLGYINALNLIPINATAEMMTSTIVAKIAYQQEDFRVPERVYKFLSKTIESINIALESMIYDLCLKLVVESKSIDKDGEEQYLVKIYSVRGEKQFSVQYESEGIKRIISILSLLISAYNNEETTLIIDELDSGLFEFMLGELIGVMERYAKGQLIFTSHNLRVLEKIPQTGIICSTTNPKNRFITLQGVSGNNNKRDFYIRALTLGGQKEELYSVEELEEIGYAFRKARMDDED